MAACGTWRYAGITPGVFQALQSQGRQKGFSIPGTPSGSFGIRVAGMQVSFQYQWDARTGSLALTCTAKPALLGCGTIKGFADQIVVGSGGRPV